MKKTFLFTTIAAIAVCFLFVKGTSEHGVANYPGKDTTVVMPAKVKAVVDEKCYGCHNTNSKNQKGKAKMNWDSLSLYSVKVAMKKLDDVTEVMEKGEMPPEKFLKSKPEAKLSEKQIKIMKDWAASAADKLVRK